MRANRLARLSIRSEEGGSVGLEDSFELFCWRPFDGVYLRETDGPVGELAGGLTLEVFGCDDGGLDDLDGFPTGAVTTAHLEVKLGDGAAESHVTVLLVHVDGAGPGVVSHEDAEVLHAAGLLLGDLASGDDLALYAADLVLALHVVPELGPGEDFIPGENADAIEGGLRRLVARQLPADNIELTHLQTKTKVNHVHSEPSPAITCVNRFRPPGLRWRLHLPSSA
jgi:hypothetical protein